MQREGETWPTPALASSGQQSLVEVGDHGEEGRINRREAVLHSPRDPIEVATHEGTGASGGDNGSR